MYKEMSNHYPELVDSLSQEEELWIRIKDLNPNLTLPEFYQIISQVDFDIENYEISKRISIEEQAKMDMNLLRKRFLEFLDEMKFAETHIKPYLVECVEGELVKRGIS